VLRQSRAARFIYTHQQDALDRVVVKQKGSS